MSIARTHIGAAPAWPPTQQAASSSSSTTGAEDSGPASKARRAASFWRHKVRRTKAQKAAPVAVGAAPAAAAPPPSDCAPAPKIAQLLHRTDGDAGVGGPSVTTAAAAAAKAAGAANEARPTHQGGCGPWLRRNWIPLALLLLGLLGLLLALVFFLEPCPAVMVTTANPADVVVLLDGSGSIAAPAFRQQLAAASHLLGATGLGATFAGDAADNYRAGVAQYSGCYDQGPPGAEDVVCPAGLNDPAADAKRAARTEAPLSGDTAAVTALLDASADAGATAAAEIAQLDGFTWFGAALVTCATELEARGQGHGAASEAGRRGVCTRDAAPGRKATSTTTTEAGCRGAGRAWHALGAPLGLCVLVSDGSNNDGSWSNDAASPEYSEAYPFGVYPWCEAHGLAAAGACTAAGIADYLKDTLRFKIMGIFVNGAGAGAGSPAAVAAGQENMKRFSSCNGGATAAAAAAGGGGAAAAAVNATGCSFYAQADNFAALAASAKAIGASLGTEVGSSAYYMCTTDPIWFHFLWLFLPLLCYLLWRPATLLLAGFLIHRRRNKLDAAARHSDRKAVELAALEAGAAAAAAAAAVPPAAGPKPGQGRRRKWTLVAADHYLWNLGGAGAAPMRVDFGAGAAPPSAPKQSASRRARRSVFAWEPPSAEDVYEPHEPQPGDLDYEYTKLWMKLLSCACCPSALCCCCGGGGGSGSGSGGGDGSGDGHTAGGGGGAAGGRVVSGIGGAETPQAGGAVAVRQPSLVAAPARARSPPPPQV